MRTRRHRETGHTFYPAELLRGQEAQGTVEYAVLAAALLAMLVALAAIWRASEKGGFARLVEEAASHALDGPGLLDIVLF